MGDNPLHRPLSQGRCPALPSAPLPVTPDGCPRPSPRPRPARTCRACAVGCGGPALALASTMRVAPGLTETDQGRSIVSGPVIMGGAFRPFAAARSRRSWLATWPVMSV
jgi:hypothetical protein